MSNESTVSPYAGSATSNIGGAVIAAGAACVIGAVVGTVSLARWLSEETPEDRENLEQVRADRRRERLAGSNERPRAITSVELVLRDPETLVRSAERLGYRLESLARPAGTLRSQPHMLLRSASGERMAIEPTKEGRVIVHTAGDRGRIHKVVRQHSGDQVTQFYAAKSMTVQSVRLANGEMQFYGRERDAG
ncbi:MAG: hypothetical protein Q8R92_08940, partial [Deltaproteobacteria bacterium]|nr:hypothetical protein [Deltaproteobacteria bacterium]